MTTWSIQSMFINNLVSCLIKFNNSYLRWSMVSTRAASFLYKTKTKTLFLIKSHSNHHKSLGSSQYSKVKMEWNIILVNFVNSHYRKYRILWLKHINSKQRNEVYSSFFFLAKSLSGISPCTLFPRWGVRFKNPICRSYNYLESQTVNAVLPISTVLFHFHKNGQFFSRIKMAIAIAP